MKNHQLSQQASAAAASSLSMENDEDPLSPNYGNVPLAELHSKEVADLNKWTRIGDLNPELKDKEV